MQALYERDTIYDLNESSPDSWTFVGKSESLKLIICSEADWQEEQNLLNNISAAVGFSDSQLIRLDLERGDHFPLHKLIHDRGIQTVLSFGITPTQLGLPAHLNPNQLYRFESLNFCFTHSLIQMGADQNHKKLFWAFAKANLIK